MFSHTKKQPEYKVKWWHVIAKQLKCSWYAICVIYSTQTRSNNVIHLLYFYKHLFQRQRLTLRAETLNHHSISIPFVFYIKFHLSFVLLILDEHYCCWYHCCLLAFFTSTPCIFDYWMKKILYDRTMQCILSVFCKIVYYSLIRDGLFDYKKKIQLHIHWFHINVLPYRDAQ